MLFICFALIAIVIFEIFLHQVLCDLNFRATLGKSKKVTLIFLYTVLFRNLENRLQSVA